MRKGKVKTYLTWNKFLSMHISTIYAMDFFTIDTIFNKRYYVFFIISHKTREIVRYAITENPTREFVRQQIIEFENEMGKIIYLIHDNASQFNLHYLSYCIKDIATSFKSPNMNSVAERFVLSVRQEALDNFIIINQIQIKNILNNYIYYYNFYRPHQGIEQQVPKNTKRKDQGRFLKCLFYKAYITIITGSQHDGYNYSIGRVFFLTNESHALEFFSYISNCFISFYLCNSFTNLGNITEGC